MHSESTRSENTTKPSGRTEPSNAADAEPMAYDDGDYIGLVVNTDA